MLPHLKGVLACGAIDVEVSFGETVDYTVDSNRKQVAAEVTGRIRQLLSDLLLGRERA
jgi:1-acyl-sn-glycerol-3-phosphate acyltransferase